MSLTFLKWASVCALWLYSVLLLNFVNKIFLDTRKNHFLSFLPLGFANAAAFMQLWYLTNQVHYYHVIGFIAVVLQFKLYFKKSWRQVVFGASICIMHIGSAFVLTIAAFSYFHNISFLGVFENRILFYYSTLVSAAFLAFVLGLASYFIKNEDLITVSSINIYSQMQSAVAITAIVQNCFFSYALVHQAVDALKLILGISNFLLGTSLYYYTLGHVTKIVKMNIYNRKTEEVSNTYNTIINEKNSVEDEIRRDPVTKLYNSTYFLEVMDYLLEENEVHFVLVYCDINSLKYVNDHFGHEQGDYYISTVASILKDSIRAQDYAFRLGGDEFAIILYGDSIELIDSLLHRIHDLTAESSKNMPYVMSLCTGYVYVDDVVSTLDRNEIIDLADQYMRKNKKLFYKEGQ